MEDFQNTNCADCYFAEGAKVGTGEPCCTYPGKLVCAVNGLICLSKREGKPRV